jgi:hypothetical protein
VHLQGLQRHWPQQIHRQTGGLKVDVVDFSLDRARQ